MKSTANIDHPEVIAWPPVIFVANALAGGLVHFAVPIRMMTYSVSLWIGITLMLISAALALWAERAMQAAGTNIRPDRPALAVVKNGPYRFTRNPMYVALCLLQIAIGFVVDGLIPLLFVIPLALTLHYGVVRREETYLESKFGEQYLALKRKVRRWI